ncbi:Uncharacterized protein SCF082_LOCUS27838 [Durusdinium trenchii]|uniref:Uncharacterized protein n=1 Tax=Durusdinium trenchii TaxID=1381693 RepID=A0ABP0MH39_9DINO
MALPYLVQAMKKLQAGVSMIPEKIFWAILGFLVCFFGGIFPATIAAAEDATKEDEKEEDKDSKAVIGAKVYEPVRKLEPAIESVIPEDYQKWVPVVTRWTCKALAISLAWWIQRIISAVHSAIRGGMIFGAYLVRRLYRGAVDFLREKGFLVVDHRETYIDEAIGWSIAVLGFLMQLAMGFQLPFLFNLVLWPIQLVEAFIVWTVSA